MTKEDGGREGGCYRSRYKNRRMERRERERETARTRGAVFIRGGMRVASDKTGGGWRPVFNRTTRNRGEKRDIVAQATHRCKGIKMARVKMPPFAACVRVGDGMSQQRSDTFRPAVVICGDFFDRRWGRSESER